MSTSNNYGAALSGTVGTFAAHDGLVRGLYDSEPVYSLGLGLSQSSTLHWTLTGTVITLRTSVHDLQTSVSLFLINTGFRKYFPEAGPTPAIAPFFGAGVSGVRIAEILKEDHDDARQQTPVWNNGNFWEVGLLLPLPSLEHSWLEIALLDQRIEQIAVGGINLGGRILALGYQQRFE